MRHGRHYTVEEANAAIEWLDERLEKLRSARRRFTDEEARSALAAAAPTNGGGTPGKVVGQAFVELQALLNQFNALELVIRDVDRGLVDFPALRDGDEIYLCWEQGEDRIGYWHDADSGYAGRQPL